MWLQLHGELDASRSRMRVLELELGGLLEEIAALEQDPFAIERAIREELELARPGEVMIRFRSSASGLGSGR